MKNTFCIKKNCTFAALNKKSGGVVRMLVVAGIFYACTLQIIYGSTTPYGSSNARKPLWCLATESVEPFFYSTIIKFFKVMSNTREIASGLKISTPQARSRTKRVEKVEPVKVQVIHQLVIPEKPVGLIGEKVVYNPAFLRKCKFFSLYPVPESGYFTITKSVLLEDGRVMVKLYPYEDEKLFEDTHICLSTMRKWEGGKV
jgi:hypothetical protein